MTKTILILITGIILLSSCLWESQTQEQIAEQTISQFYEWYIEYNGSALMSNAYKETEYITDDFKIRIETILKDSEGLIKKDPFTCIKSKSEKISTGPATIKEKDTAEVIVMQYSGNNISSVKAIAKNNNNKWQIDEIICPEAEK